MLSYGCDALNGHKALKLEPWNVVPLKRLPSSMLFLFVFRVRVLPVVGRFATEVTYSSECFTTDLHPLGKVPGHCGRECQP
eukprot:749357-Hanusia_phi.AAC.6